jgi:uncharacterized protein (TIGR03663 family)
MFAWDWEKIAWAMLLIAAALLRLVALENRSMSHDESEHAWFAYNLYSGAGYQHSPIYHGPFAYHVLALFYLVFGDSTVMARIPTALFGVGAVWLIWWFRPWLGRIGAFLAAGMVTLSPALLHYSRHTRHDIYEIFWALLFFLAIFRYLEASPLPRAQRPVRWLYVAAAALSLMLAVKEVAFIYGAVIGAFLLLVILVRWIGQRLAPTFPEDEAELPFRITSRDGLVLIGAIVLSLVGPILYRVLGLSTQSAGLALVASFLVVFLPPAIAIGLVGWYLRRREHEDVPDLAFSSATDLAILLGTLILPWLAPFAITALGYDPLNYAFPGGILPSLSVLVAFLSIAVVVGIFWDARRWLVAAGLFTGIFVLFFTTLFTNGQGIATGVVGSLGYWISQQEVARGGQPWYYYLLVVPLYEFLPLLLSLPVVLGALFRRNVVSLLLLTVLIIAVAGALLTQGGLAADQEQSLLQGINALLRGLAMALGLFAVAWGGLSRFGRPRTYFLAFLPLWVVFSWVAYTVAGEKMPWLTTHIALPMCLAGGWWLGQVVESVDWSTVRQRGGIWVAVLVLPLAAALVAVLGSQPFRDRTIDGLSETTQWLAALVVLAIVVILLWRQMQRVGWRQGLRVAGLTLALLLGLWSLRTSYMLNFLNQDYVSEYLFYAHASPDPRLDMADIEAISRRVAGDKQIKVVYDDDSSWPFNWYLRDWPNGTYIGSGISREAFRDAPVVIIGSKNLDQARPYLVRDYQEFNHRLIWWPEEGYKNTGWEKIWQGLTDPEKRREFLDVVIWREHTTPLSNWPLVHRYSLFVRNDVAAQMWDFGTEPTAVAGFTDPYEEGFREVISTRVVGTGPGSADGQLNFPRNMAVAEDGTIFVADSGNHRIQAFAPDGTFVRQWGSSCELYVEGQPGCVDPDADGPLMLGDGQMREPWGIALGPQGSVYVADTWNHRILVFDQQGNLLNKWGTFVTTDGEAVGSPGGFWGPRAIAVDSIGNLYVTDTGNKRIQVFDADGIFLGQYGGGGVIEGRFDEPVGLAIVSDRDGQPGGRLYVADTWNRRVQELQVTYGEDLADVGDAQQPVFSFVREWPIEGWSSQSIVNKPYLAVDSEGMLYVSDPENWRMLVFDGEGNFQGTFGLFGSDASSFALPVGVAIGPDDNVYVADSDNHRIMQFAPVR